MKGNPTDFRFIRHGQLIPGRETCIVCVLSECLEQLVGHLKLLHHDKTFQQRWVSVSMACHAILSVLDCHAPLKFVQKNDRRPCPWLTDHLVQLVRNRNSLHKLLMRDQQNSELRNQHRQARAAARQEDRRLKCEYLLSQCQTPDQRKLWKVINTVTGRGNSHQQPKAQLADLSSTFEAVVTDPGRPANLLPSSGPVFSQSMLKYPEVTVAEVTVAEVTVAEVEKLLRNIDPSKSTGSDGIPGIVLKQSATVLAPSLQRIFNISLRTGHVPRLFKVSRVSPLYKGGDRSSATNYRPVSLLPIVSRLLEFFVKTFLSKHLVDHNLLPASQFVYRKNHSTEDALVYAVDRWLAAKADHKTTGAVTVDMSKAFDRVLHARLLDILLSIGIGGMALSWFSSYLSVRTQQVKIGSALSTRTHCTRRVLQGSVLGPLFFILYTKDIINTVLPAEVSHQEFADDIELEFSHRDPQVVATTLSVAVSSLEKWLTSIGLLLNCQKTQVMFIGAWNAAPV